MTAIRRALISVSDKTGLVEFAAALADMGVEIVSTGGTMKTLRDAGIPVTYVSDVTGFPEIMDGRVKTLNPYIHGGILAVRDNDEHQAAMVKHGIVPIDLVVVNLYPFRQTIARPDVTLAEAVENIDIGGPALIRAAAKNFRFVTVVVNPSRYQEVIGCLRSGGAVPDELRMALAAEAYHHTGAYDAHIASYLVRQNCPDEHFPQELHLVYEKVSNLRYGENPHQKAAFYREKYNLSGGLANATQLHGKELSFNNLVDLESAYRLVAEFDRPAAAIIKHTNPCGAAVGDSQVEAYRKAYGADTVSAYGGIAACNRQVDGETAAEMSKIFLEAVIAPAFTQEALTILTAKQNIRLLAADLPLAETAADIKKISGGILLQDADQGTAPRSDMTVATSCQPAEGDWDDLLFAWKVVKHVKSNAIVVAKDGVTLGVGAGQMNRVGAAALALNQADQKAKGAVLASDAFFPFSDTVELAADFGITAIIQPGGSVRDEASIQAADKLSVAMVFTGMRHFKH